MRHRLTSRRKAVFFMSLWGVNRLAKRKQDADRARESKAEDKAEGGERREKGKGAGKSPFASKKGKEGR